MAIDEQIKSMIDNTIRKMLLSEVFWESCNSYLSLMKPVADAITKLEGDSITLPLVVQLFSEVEKDFNDNLEKSFVLKSEEPAARKIITQRRQFLIKKVHLAADLLNPKSAGSHLSNDERVSAC